jgi:hypothetical protein
MSVLQCPIDLTPAPQRRNKTPKRRLKAKLRDDRRRATRSNETWRLQSQPRQSRKNLPAVQRQGAEQ